MTVARTSLAEIRERWDRCDDYDVAEVAVDVVPPLLSALERVLPTCEGCEHEGKFDNDCCAGCVRAPGLTDHYTPKGDGDG